MDIRNNIAFFRNQLAGTDCRLIAVSKTHSIEKIQEAYGAGQRIFGENKVQELVAKQAELPKDIESTPAFFRRFEIVPFKVTIPEAEQDKELAKRIIKNELSGIFNWVLEGLKRLLDQKRLTESEEIKKAIDSYKMMTDNVHSFIVEEEYIKSTNESQPLSTLYTNFKAYCEINGCRPVANKNFSERLRGLGFSVERKSAGMMVYIKKDLKKF